MTRIKKERLSDKNPEWFNERIDAFDLYWENKISKQEFQQRIEEIDFKYKHRDEYAKKRIKEIQEETKKKQENAKERMEEIKEKYGNIIEEYEELRKEVKE